MDCCRYLWHPALRRLDNRPKIHYNGKQQKHNEKSCEGAGRLQEISLPSESHFLPERGGPWLKASFSSNVISASRRSFLYERRVVQDVCTRYVERCLLSAAGIWVVPRKIFVPGIFVRFFLF